MIGAILLFVMVRDYWWVPAVFVWFAWPALLPIDGPWPLCLWWGLHVSVLVAIVAVSTVRAVPGWRANRRFRREHPHADVEARIAKSDVDRWLEPEVTRINGVDYLNGERLNNRQQLGGF